MAQTVYFIHSSLLRLLHQSTTHWNTSVMWSQIQVAVSLEYKVEDGDKTYNLQVNGKSTVDNNTQTREETKIQKTRQH